MPRVVVNRCDRSGVSCSMTHLFIIRWRPSIVHQCRSYRYPLSRTSNFGEDNNIPLVPLPAAPPPPFPPPLNYISNAISIYFHFLVSASTLVLLSIIQFLRCTAFRLLYLIQSRGVDGPRRRFPFPSENAVEVGQITTMTTTTTTTHISIPWIPSRPTLPERLSPFGMKSKSVFWERQQP